MSLKGAWLWLAVALIASRLSAQELEPRALVNAPIGVNYFTAAGGYLYGNVLLDASLPLDNGKARVGTLSFGYVRSIDFFGLAGKIGFAVPTATGRWEANLAGRDTSTTRTGFGDPVLRLSVNFVGSPALTMSESRSYRQSTVVGAAIAVSVPIGQYFTDRLINLGTNRWAFSPRLGASQFMGRWLLEVFATASFYTTNHDFFGGQTLEQRPFYDAQAHVTYTIHGKDWWAAGSCGYGWGGRSIINGVEKDQLENLRISATFRMPIARGQALKFAYINGLKTAMGTDFDTFQIAYQYAWGGKP